MSPLAAKGLMFQQLSIDIDRYDHRTSIILTISTSPTNSSFLCFYLRFFRRLKFFQGSHVKILLPARFRENELTFITGFITFYFYLLRFKAPKVKLAYFIECCRKYVIFLIHISIIAWMKPKICILKRLPLC